MSSFWPPHMGGSGGNGIRVHYWAAVFLILLPLIFASRAQGEKLEVRAVAAPPESLVSMSLQDLVALEVFESANLLPEQPAKAPGTVYSFDQADFKRFGVRRVEDLLPFIPGFQLNQYRKNHQSLWARGSVSRYNDKLILLVDGVRRQHLYYGHFALGEEWPLEQIEKVEVILGPASSLYGASAFSGLISITTKGFTADPNLAITLESGSGDRAKSTLHYSSEKMTAFGSYLEHEAAYSNNRYSFIGNQVLQSLDEQYTTLSLKGQLLPGLTLAANYSAAETPFLFIPPTQDAYIDSESWSLALSYDVGEVESGRLETNLYYQQDNILEYETEQLTNRLGYEEQQNGTMAGLSVTGLQQTGNHIWALGATWRYEAAGDMDYQRDFHFARGFLSQTNTGSLLIDSDVRKQDYGVFLQDVWSWTPALKLTAGIRYDVFEHFDNYFNYRIAAVYSPAQEHTWKLLYGTAIRTPTLREYLKVLDTSNFTPSELDAETLQSLEASYRYQQARWDVSFTAYHNYIDDYIVEMPTPDGRDEYYGNTDYDLTINGVEAVFGLHMNDRLSTRLGLSYVDSLTSSGYRLPYIAKLSGSFNVAYQWLPRHQLGMSIVFNDDREDLNARTDDDAERFALMSVFLQGDLHKQLSYQVGVSNVLDDRVMDLAADFGSQYNTEKERRSLWLTLTWSPMR